jgi:hypothetical protein
VPTAARIARPRRRRARRHGHCRDLLDSLVDPPPHRAVVAVDGDRRPVHPFLVEGLARPLVQRERGEQGDLQIVGQRLDERPQTTRKLTPHLHRVVNFRNAAHGTQSGSDTIPERCGENSPPFAQDLQLTDHVRRAEVHRSSPRRPTHGDQYSSVQPPLSSRS